MARMILTLLVFAVAVTPAVVHALRGIQTLNGISVSDCKGEWAMTTELIDLSSPVAFQAENQDVLDGADIHGKYGVKAGTIDATKYGMVEPYIEFAPGSNLGNSVAPDGSPRPNVLRTGANPGVKSDQGVCRVKGTCMFECDGQWVVVLKQRTWHKVTVHWTKAESDQRPFWAIGVFSFGVDGSLQRMRTKAEYNPIVGNMKTTADSKIGMPPSNPSGGTDHEVIVAESGNPPTAATPYVGGAWSANADQTVVAQTFYEVNPYLTTLGCAGTLEVDVPVEALLTWRMEIEDANSTVNYDPSVDRNRLEARIEYGTWIDLWSILVIMNCDTTTQGCACLQLDRDLSGAPWPDAP